ncbi:uncharacterized protein N7515_004913 [Penicillium bovifimosum]|uniref:Alginate lyase domain-containing protein n=1 Tax=Penicillium bovifimosum TaxID=126998 RepID=A0A9W9H1B0_9EURO|nr:uncharacterized protein N7515_004913 [Penicillium bovifimosum]KAJ5135635.1 hypothetical protein N7515_004913 [Penicillium bovifimosum]
MLSSNFILYCTGILSAVSVCNAFAVPPEAHRPAKTANLSPIPTEAPKKWVHPGVFVSAKQLDFIGKKVAHNEGPWSNAFTSMMNYNYSSPTRTAVPYKTVECGPTSTPNIGCYQEREDSMAAYINSLAYWITKENKYAKKAIEYMDAWSSTIQGHANSNAPLQAAWSAANWVRAGEIMRYAPGGHWSKKGIQQFADMLTKVYLPIILPGDAANNGNWDLVMMESSIGIAVFTENKTTYEDAMGKFAGRVPAYIYLTSDGPYPVPGRGIEDTPSALIKYWQGQQYFNVSGLTQETCRDYAHTSYSIASMSHVAETSRIQGKDLWLTNLGVRVKAALELHSSFETGEEPIPSWICGGQIARSMDPVLEPPYNALAYRMHESMPHTRKFLEEQRPAEIGEPEPLFIGFETVTNAEIPF